MCRTGSTHTPKSTALSEPAQAGPLPNSQAATARVHSPRDTYQVRRYSQTTALVSGALAEGWPSCGRAVAEG